MKKVFFSMVIVLGLVSLTVFPATSNSTMITTYSHGMEH